MSDTLSRLIACGARDATDADIRDCLTALPTERERIFAAVLVLHIRGDVIQRTNVTQLLGVTHNWFSNASPETEKDRQAAFDAATAMLPPRANDLTQDDVARLTDDVEALKATVTALQAEKTSLQGRVQMANTHYRALMQSQRHLVVEEMSKRDHPDVQRVVSQRRGHLRAVPEQPAITECFSQRPTEQEAEWFAVWDAETDDIEEEF